MPSQQSSLRGRRTALTCHDWKAEMVAALKAPSRAAPVRPELSGFVPSSKTVLSPDASHMYSLPARSTPSGRTTWPALLSILFPDTCNPLLLTVAACALIGALHARLASTRLRVMSINGIARKCFLFTLVLLLYHRRWLAVQGK